MDPIINREPVGLDAGLAHPHWRKSSRSLYTGACVEVAPVRGGQLAVRDSKDKSGPVLVFRSEMWQAFVSGVKNGQFGSL